MRVFKTVMSLAFIVMLLAPNYSSAQEPQVSLEFENAESAMQVVQNYVDALQKGDVDTMNAQLTDNAMIHGLGGGLDSLNVAQHKEYYTNSVSKYKHSMSRYLYLPVKVTNNWNEGEWILCWGINTVTDKKSGKVIPIPFHTINRVINGKIEYVRYYYDMLNIVESQGFTLTPPKK